MCESGNVRIKRLIDARGIKPTQFALDTGVKNSTLFAIYKGKTKFGNIRIETFARIARGLGMSLDELWGDEQHGGLSEDESLLLAAYRKANQIGKYFILRSAETVNSQDPNSLFSGNADDLVIHHSDPWPDE